MKLNLLKKINITRSIEIKALQESLDVVKNEDERLAIQNQITEKERQITEKEKQITALIQKGRDSGNYLSF